MKIGILALLAGLLLVSGIFLIDSRVQEQETDLRKPWIEVLKLGVTELAFEGDKIIRELKTGDELQPPTIIETGAGGLANIYFPDGSVARLDSATKLLLEQGSYQDQTLRVKILLTAGRVWSKILTLATPQSLWEVRTANAVATVRGTAFGVEYINGRTSVIGSENQVAVSLINPQSNKIVAGTEVFVSERKYLTVDDAEARAAAATKVPAVPLVVPAPKNILEQEWIKRFEAADVGIKLEVMEAFETRAPAPSIKKEAASEPVLIKAEEIQTKEIPIIEIIPSTNVLNR